MNVADIKRRVRSQIGDSAGTITEDQDIWDLITDAQTRINAELKIVTATAVINTVAGTNRYNLPADLLIPGKLQLSGSGNPKFLEPTTELILNRDHPDWADTTNNRGIPRYYFIDGLSYGLYPTPDAAYAGILSYVKIPNTIVADVTALELPAWTHLVIPRMCVALVKEKDEDFEAAERIKGEVILELGRLRAQVNGTVDRFHVIQEPDDWEYAYE